MSRMQILAAFERKYLPNEKFPKRRRLFRENVRVPPI